MSALYLPPYEQLIISGEDIRIFILHIFGAPSSWYPSFYASTGCAGRGMRCKGWTVIPLRCNLNCAKTVRPQHQIIPIQSVYLDIFDGL